MGFGQTKDLKLYAFKKEKAEKSWVSHEEKIWIVIKKRMGFGLTKKSWLSGTLKIWIFMKKEEKRWSLTKLKIWNYKNIHRKRQKNHGFWANRRFGLS